MSANNDAIFSIQNLVHSDGKVSAVVTVNENCAILKGHFPGQPVVPGACMLQLVKGVLEKAFGRNIRLTKADSIKFMSMIVPGGEGELELVIGYKITENDIYSVQATLNNGETTCFKFQGFFM